MGEVVADTIKHDLQVKASAAEAFKAVGTQAGINAWWAKNGDVAEAQGGPVELRFDHKGMKAVMQFDVTELQPDRRVEWTCRENSNPIWPGSRLAWEIEPAATGSVVHFRHEGLKDGGNYQEIVQGWQYFMDSLQSYLDGGTPTPSD
jgi:uncharacterized protein YndB with AHSA1/START domain